MGNHIYIPKASTPIEIPDLCSYFQGGIVVYNNGNGGGLIAAPSIITAGLSIKTTISDDNPFPYTGIYGDYGRGMQNTLDMVSRWGAQAQVANYCLNYTNDGYSDWFLPSFDEAWLLSNANNNMWNCLKTNWYGGIDPTNNELLTSSTTTNFRDATNNVYTGGYNARAYNRSDMDWIPCRYIT